jgi:transmembrane sensor
MEYYHSDFDGFTEDQFAANDYFRQWVLFAEPDNDEFWSSYLQKYPHQQTVILNARKKVEVPLSEHEIQPLTPEEKSIMKQAIYQQINEPVQRVSFLRQKSISLLKVAAIVSGIIMMTAYFLNKKPVAGKILLVQQRTGMKEIKEILLADSSVVILNGNSSITYNNDIGHNQNREISLEGNAYFKVKTKADRRSFTVRTNSISIAVHGTEFNVDARSKATEIVLTSGKVKVSADNNNASAIYMSPGEKVKLDTLQQSFIKSNINTLLYSAWTEGRWNFSSTTLLDITNLVYEYYGVETKFSSEKIKRLKVSAVIPVTDLASFTNILSKTLDLKITEKNNQLTIQY